MSAELLDLLEEDPATGILVAADELEHEAGRCADAEGAFRWTDPADGARLMEWMRATAHGWRGVVKRHLPRPCCPPGSEKAKTCPYAPVCYHCEAEWPCSDITETVAEARAFLGGKP